jgi:hypothetical protein
MRRITEATTIMIETITIAMIAAVATETDVASQRFHPINNGGNSCLHSARTNLEGKITARLKAKVDN